MNREAKKALGRAESIVKIFDMCSGKDYLRGVADTLLVLDYLTPEEYVNYTCAVNKSNY